MVVCEGFANFGGKDLVGNRFLVLLTPLLKVGGFLLFFLNRVLKVVLRGVVRVAFLAILLLIVIHFLLIVIASQALVVPPSIGIFVMISRTDIVCLKLHIVVAQSLNVYDVVVTFSIYAYLL